MSNICSSCPGHRSLALFLNVACCWLIGCSAIRQTAGAKSATLPTPWAFPTFLISIVRSNAGLATRRPTFASGYHRKRRFNAKGAGCPAPYERFGPTCRLTRLRHDPNIRLRRLPTLREQLLGVVVGHRAGDDDVIAALPVHRRRHLVLGAELQRVDDAQHLVEVAADRHRIDQDQLDLLVRTNDEDVADGLVVGCGAFGCVARD